MLFNFHDFGYIITNYLNYEVGVYPCPERKGMRHRFLVIGEGSLNYTRECMKYDGFEELECAEYDSGSWVLLVCQPDGWEYQDDVDGTCYCLDHDWFKRP